MALPQYFLQEIKYKNDLSDVAASYLDLKRRGKNLVGLCPFHNEKTPSFNIYPDNGSFYCFGCSTGGDVITFIMKIENLDYMEAVKYLAERGGIQMPEEGHDDSIGKLKTRILEINRETARFFYNTLMSPEGKAGLDYLRRRSLDNSLIKRFGLGYSPGTGFALVNHLKSLGYTDSEMVQANVAGFSKNKKAYDRFKSRVMFPIIDLRGNVVAFGGRILTDEKPKYINTSDTLVYHKSNGLFAMNIAKNNKEGRLILAEGYMDVISLHKAGFTNAIASLGTSLTAEQARVISRYANEVVICYDSDEAGQRATTRAIPILKNAGLYVKVVSVPGNKDPDEFINFYGADGPARFRALIDESGNDIEYKLFKLKQSSNLETSEGRHKFLLDGIKVIADISDRMAREIYAETLSQETGVSRTAIMDEAEKIVRKENNKRYKEKIKSQNEIYAIKSSMNKEKRGNARIANAEEGIISYILANPDKIKAIKEKLPPDKMITEFNRRVYEILLGKTIYGELTLTELSEDFTSDEMSEIARIIANNNSISVRDEDVEEYIKVVLSRTGFIDKETIKSASASDIEQYMETLRKQKIGGNE